jgi:hypothetical protein
MPKLFISMPSPAGVCCLFAFRLTHRRLFSSIQQVKSRTKEFAYGLYWKQNRKNCIAFLSFDAQRSMDAHMRWVDCQIQTLETYRKGKLTTDDVNHTAILRMNVGARAFSIVSVF